MIEGSMSMNKRDEPVTAYYVAEKAAEDGADPVRLAGPMKPGKVDRALETLREQHPEAFVMAVWNQPGPGR